MLFVLHTSQELVNPRRAARWQCGLSKIPAADLPALRQMLRSDAPLWEGEELERCVGDARRDRM